MQPLNSGGEETRNTSSPPLALLGYVSGHFKNDLALAGTLRRSAPGKERDDYAERLAPASPKSPDEGGWASRLKSVPFGSDAAISCFLSQRRQIKALSAIRG